MRSPGKLYFGPAGIPHSAKGKPIKEGVIEVKRLGLDAMEIEFVRRISLTEKAAVEVEKTARSLGVLLTVHAPYYINLASKDQDKLEKSIERIVKSAIIGKKAGAWSVCFHAGYYLGRSPDEVYRIISDALQRALEELDSAGVKIWIRPETTGKPTQFGSLEETVKLSQELENVLPVVDFAHLHARSNGKYNTYEEFTSVLEYIEKYLGKTALRNMHIHISGIDYGEKGEIQHLNLEESDLNYKDLIQALRDFNVKGAVICESPNLEDDALLLRNTYRKTRKRKTNIPRKK